jgi:hypothetical protein
MSPAYNSPRKTNQHLRKSADAGQTKGIQTKNAPTKAGMAFLTKTGRRLDGALSVATHRSAVPERALFNNSATP